LPCVALGHAGQVISQRTARGIVCAQHPRVSEQQQAHVLDSVFDLVCVTPSLAQGLADAAKEGGIVRCEKLFPGLLVVGQAVGDQLSVGHVVCGTRRHESVLLYWESRIPVLENKTRSTPSGQPRQRRRSGPLSRANKQLAWASARVGPEARERPLLRW